MLQMTIQVNGKRYRVTASPDTPLLFVLRDELHLHGPRFGCGLAQCGACSVLLHDQDVRSCVTPVGSVSGERVTTLEGLGTISKPSVVQRAFIDAQAAQCGYCTNGMIIAATALLKAIPHPSEDEIKTVMNPWLCRCGTHFRIVEAIKNAAKAAA